MRNSIYVQFIQIHKPKHFYSQDKLPLIMEEENNKPGEETSESTSESQTEEKEEEKIEEKKETAEESQEQTSN